MSQVLAPLQWNFFCSSFSALAVPQMFSYLAEQNQIPSLSLPPSYCSSCSHPLHIPSTAGFGNSLLDRLCHPLTTDPTFRTLNENTKHSLSLLRSRLEELDRRTVDFATMMSQQQALLSNFLTYCKFEQNVEEVRSKVRFVPIGGEGSS